MWVAWLFGWCAGGSDVTVVCIRKHALAYKCCAGCAWHLLSRVGGRRNTSSNLSPPELEAVDLSVIGVVSDMPQVRADGVRFRFNVEQALRHDNGSALALPETLHLGWHSRSFEGDTKALPVLRAGER